MVDKINIAIDGHAGCGKSTTAKRVAEAFDYLYIDTGAMYRAVTLYFLRHNIPYETENLELIAALNNIELDFEFVQGHTHRAVTLNGEPVEDQIRTPEVSAAVSPVSVHKSVRTELVRQQQRMGKRKGVVMDGRDIGTVVLPEAELKVYMTADPETRALRRQKELKKRGIEADLKEILHNLLERDRIDSTRDEGPLKQAADAFVINTTGLTIKTQTEKVIDLAKEVIGTQVEMKN